MTAAPPAPPEAPPQPAQPERPLRVLHFVSGGFSGATQVAIDLCAPHPGQQTLLVLRRRASVNPAERVAALRARGLQVEVVTRWPRLATIWAIARICRRWQPDVLVAHGFSEHLWGRYAGLLAGVPHLIQVEHNVRERYRWPRLAQSLWLAQRTDRIIGVSQAVRDALLHTGHPAGRCTVIVNGIELGRWNQGQPWAQREDAIVMPARFAQQKDQDTLIRATALLAARGLRPVVYLAGEGKQSWMRRSQQLAATLGVSGQVRFMGHVGDLPQLMGRVKLCVLSTHYEGLGLGLIEGMASGCCAIGSDVEGVRECFVHGESGLLVPHANAQALADTLHHLLTHPGQAQRLAAAGQAHARQHFDRQRMIDEYLALFRQVGGIKKIENPE